MEFFPEKLEKYMEQHSKPETETLKKLNRETYSKIIMPQMLSGHIQGLFLKAISAMIKPKHVLEIGTFTGYSSICLAEGLQEGGLVHTIDINEELLPMVKRYVSEAGLEKKVKTYTGNALELIPKMNDVFDLVFIDADKKNYVNYYNLVFDKVRKGGFILADNVLWSGKVIEKVKKSDEETMGIMNYNEMITKDERVENVIIPMRDGVMIARKL
jgi:predicted O-methyltransferase YrrM